MPNCELQVVQPALAHERLELSRYTSRQPFAGILFAPVKLTVVMPFDQLGS